MSYMRQKPKPSEVAILKYTAKLKLTLSLMTAVLIATAIPRAFADDDWDAKQLVCGLESFGARALGESTGPRDASPFGRQRAVGGDGRIECNPSMRREGGSAVGQDSIDCVAD
jgi:hypothetical protein